MKIEINGIEELPNAAKEFISAMGKHRIFAFHGEMGAGKTTFICELCRALGVIEPANSPSFSIINEYVSDKDRQTIFHFDFYRLNSPQEALEIGVEDYFYSGNLCLIEWPEMIGTLLPDEAVYVRVEEDPLSGKRTISIEE
ncbi:MAG: tRNA (adenosine(37)-N6)-threonylcarbamoyltransferase complex ATPase subunit type 1 TsaE [Prevotella sp.]|nr:tRNA (adenosine(37)-N6)-threonylcarbamoyltransferase complex ATPase subunit type 1 TsaE [Bacteroides sp.]MCM1366024.1 tRNA (adenosine(37)-N6)-threonylcarbamoyltransferase complex ATPase subunit type 1 TsaE [Prevotella sp.]MCM1436906.1 tRNA (adenosine(37)-N6)-threonylcarbamoyltransferase complex ATPase subunit type 1 TsaE [Prevotella sp.]